MHHIDLLFRLMMLRTVYMNKRQELPQPEEEKLPLDGQDVKMKNLQLQAHTNIHAHICLHTETHYYCFNDFLK